MKRISVLFVSFLFMSVLVFTTDVSARSMEKSAHKPMTPAQIAERKERKRAMVEKRQAMKKEMHAILLETIALIKEIAKDDGAKVKATELEKRLQKHIDEMESHHKAMKGKHGMKMKGMSH